MSVVIEWPAQSGILSTTKFVNVNVECKVKDTTPASICLVYSDTKEVVTGSYQSKPPNTLEGNDYINGSIFSNEQCSFKVRCAVHSAHHDKSLFRFLVTVQDVHIYSEEFRTKAKLSRKQGTDFHRNVRLCSDAVQNSVKEVSELADDSLGDLTLEELSDNFFSDVESLSSTHDDSNMLLATVMQLVNEVSCLRNELQELRNLVKN
jgi:hypothetical protein